MNKIFIGLCSIIPHNSIIVQGGSIRYPPKRQNYVSWIHIPSKNTKIVHIQIIERRRQQQQQQNTVAINETSKYSTCLEICLHEMKVSYLENPFFENFFVQEYVMPSLKLSISRKTHSPCYGQSTFDEEIKEYSS